MGKEILIVGGGISSLTAAAYLLKNNNQVKIIEKTEKVGGLVGSFYRNNFLFDSGIRATENSGVLLPMFKDLGIDIEFLENKVSIIIENNKVELDKVNGLKNYQEMLIQLFPNYSKDVSDIIDVIKKISSYMEVLYGIDNPLFLDMKRDKNYLIKTIVPWLFKYQMTINKIQNLSLPVNTFLGQISDNSSLIDMITQHFFKETPTFFALSYFRLYTDYYYPKGGTRTVIDKLEAYIIDNGGEIIKNTEIIKVKLDKKEVLSNQNIYKYDQLIWGADLKNLYRVIDVHNSNDYKKKGFEILEKNILKSHGNDSLFSLYVSTNLSLEYYSGKCGCHNFYTPNKIGLSSMKYNQLQLLEELKNTNNDRETILFSWIDEFVEKTTFEISIPVLRDLDLAPKNKSALIISAVFDYDLTKFIYDISLYEVFKRYMEKAIIDSLSKTLLCELKNGIIESFSSTPLTIKKRFNNSEGAITGWSFTETSPTENRMKKIAKSIDTPFKDIYQIGHWTFSPSGLPTAIIVAKLAADKIGKSKK
jgi:phytoene dehydrogenase-like protein